MYVILSFEFRGGIFIATFTYAFLFFNALEMENFVQNTRVSLNNSLDSFKGSAIRFVGDSSEVAPSNVTSWLS